MFLHLKISGQHGMTRSTLTLQNLTKTISKTHSTWCWAIDLPYLYGKACLSKQPPWHAAGDSCLAHGRARVQAPAPAGALRVLLFSTPLPSSFRRYFCTFPTNPAKVLGLIKLHTDYHGGNGIWWWIKWWRWVYSTPTFRFWTTWLWVYRLWYVIVVIFLELIKLEHKWFWWNYTWLWFY